VAQPNLQNLYNLKQKLMNDDSNNSVNQESIDKNQIFDWIKEIGEQERHFNNISSIYKSLASTWLLATFGAIGFIMINKIEPKELTICIISFAGSIGIFLLWLIDLRVYQQLLAANFVEGYELEKKYSWLPQIRHSITKTQKTGTVVSNLSWFYIIAIEILFVTSIFFFAKFLLSKSLLSILFWPIYSLLAVLVFKVMLLKADEEILKGSLQILYKPYKVGQPIYWICGILLFFFLLAVNFNDIKSNIRNEKSDNEIIDLNNQLLNKHLLNCKKIDIVKKTLNGRKEYKDTVGYKSYDCIFIEKGEANLWINHKKKEFNLKPNTLIIIPSNSEFKVINIANDTINLIKVELKN